ncbi:hypothetical protein CerSpe_129270 [Prunus speciosa]
MCALPYYNNNITDAAKDNNPNNIAQLNTNYRCKVVRLISPRHGIESSKFKVQIFSSETGEWKESIVSSPQDIFLFSLKSNICFANAYNRMLYWMGENAFLVELDPFELDGQGDDHHYNYKCRVINLEDEDLDIRRGMLGCLGVHGGRLKVFNQRWYANIFHVWDVNVKKNDQGDGEIFHGGFEKVRLENLTTYRVGRDMLPNEDDVLDCLALDPNNEEILYLSLGKEIIKFNKRTGMWSKTGKEISHSNWSIDFFQVVVPWWPTPVPRLQQHAHAQPRTKNHQNQLEEEMGKFMESAPSAEVRLSSRDSCGGAAPDEEDVKVRVAKKLRTHY